MHRRIATGSGFRPPAAPPPPPVHMKVECPPPPPPGFKLATYPSNQGSKLAPKKVSWLHLQGCRFFIRGARLPPCSLVGYTATVSFLMRYSVQVTVWNLFFQSHIFRSKLFILRTSFCGIERENTYVSSWNNKWQHCYRWTFIHMLPALWQAYFNYLIVLVEI